MFLFGAMDGVRLMLPMQEYISPLGALLMVHAITSGVQYSRVEDFAAEVHDVLQAICLHTLSKNPPSGSSALRPESLHR